MKAKSQVLVTIMWLTFTFGVLSPVNSQVANPYYAFPNISCGMDDEIQTSSMVLPYFPMTQDTLRVLVVFCNFGPPVGEYEVAGSSITQYWPASSAYTKPTWADSIICPTASNIWNRSLTGLFRDASFGQFILVGDVYPDLYIFEQDPFYYKNDSARMGAAVKELLVNIDSSVNYANYDKFDPEDSDNDGNRREPDGVVDFIFINFRFTNSGTIDPGSYTGYASLSGRSGIFANGQSEITLDGKRIKARALGSGCIYEMNTPWDLGIPAHEFGEHYGYGVGHSEVMGSFNLNGGGLPSAYDREHFGWNLSASSPSNNISLTLQDFVTTGQYVKIERTYDTIFVENRRRLSYYASEEYRNWIWLSTDPRNPIMPDSGMLIYRNTYYRSFEVQSAFGKWDWKKCLSSNRYLVSFTSHTNNSFFPDKPNRYLGMSTFYLRDLLSYNENCEPINLPIFPNVSSVTYSGLRGDKNSCFDIGYNQVYSPWSNPPLPVTNANDSLTIELTGRNSDGSLAVNVYFTNILGASPSKPQLLTVEKQSIGSQFSPRLKWTRNLEPDLTGYKIYRGDGYNPASFAFLSECSDTTYLDESILLYGAGGGNGPCSYYLVQYTYAVSAYDNSNKESVRSDGAFIDGYTDPCAPIGPMINNNTTRKADKINDKPLKTEFRLFDVYPNPFNPSVTIEFELPVEVKVSILIYDVSGKEVAILSDGLHEQGRHRLVFDASALPTGIYYCRLEAGMFVNVKKLVLLK